MTLWKSMLPLFLQHAAGDGIEFGEQRGIALFGRGDEGGIEHVFDAERRRRALRSELGRHRA